MKVGTRDVEVGKPLPWSLYDGNRKLLLKRGYVIENQRQCEILIEKGLYRNVHGREAHGPRQGPVDELDGQNHKKKDPRETLLGFEETRVKIGEPLQLQSSPDSPRYYVKLIGYLKNKGLIVSAPEIDGELVMVKEGQSFIARFFPGQHAYAFTTTVAKQTSVPYPHLHLSYPREVRGLKVRKDSRIETSLIAALTLGSVDEEQASASGKIVNLSIGGAALKAKTLLGGKDDIVGVKFKINFEESDYFLALDSVIRSVTYDETDAAMPYSYGIQFVNVDNSMALALGAYFYKQLLDDA